MLRTSLLALTLLAAAIAPARAQTEPPEPFMRDVVATPYADALLKTFAASVRRHADPSCLQAKKIDDATSIAQGRAILERHGVRMLQIVEEGIDRAAYRAELAAEAGAGAEAELERLQQDPQVKQLIAIGRPARLAQVLDMVLEQFDRHLLIARIKFDTISPEGRGEPALPENPTQAAEAAEQEFYDKTDAPQLQRYLELLHATNIATQKAINLEKVAQISPKAFFGGVEPALAELCIGPR
jgi:hypothetical protein